MTRTRTLLATTAAVATLGALAGPAAASHGGGDDGRDRDDRVIRTGACSGGARWKIKAKEDDGRIEVESEVDSNRTGQRWAWVLRHDGSVSARGTATTTGRSGSFEVERRAVDGAGTDAFVFRATFRGQTCLASVRY
ncbi:hypothetical protein [Nocardioides litoris]|uniref:hypothetical protein n=1 Tax=Nocardioides litoris TaxID=1926648 RepID=UPI00112101CB|nr:hypothetical protein [Nocardioides litoris]